MNKSEMIKLFSNVNNIYYGHGIGSERQDVINSIFKNGLRCSHERLYFTTVTFGEGSNRLFEEQKENMHNWKHKGSKQIIIASLPKKYNIINVPSGPLYGKENSAFYNYFSQEEADKLGIAQGYYLKPEFVSGVYDANTQTFTKNEKYYENLPLEEQNKLFNEVKKQYIELLKGSQWTLKEYADILRRIGVENPLTEEEIIQADRTTFENNELESQTTNSVQKDNQSESNIENKKESNKAKFVKGFIQAYNDTETEYQYETRKENEESDIERVQKIINTKGLNRMLTMDLDGKWIGTPNDEDFKVEYSQKQVSAMVRLLKAAELLSNNKKLNPEGINYLEQFTSVPDIEYKLKQMHSDLKDENTYMFQLKQESKDNRTNGNIPQYEPTIGESEIITQNTKESAIKEQTGDSVQKDNQEESNVENKKESNKAKFVKGFIQAYKDTETEYQYETRRENEESDIERVQKIINTKGLNRMLTMDLDGKWIGTPNDEDFKVEYSQKQVSAMARLLKAATLLSNDKKLNPEGINYLEQFTSVPDIEYKLKQMYSDLKDENTYMFQLKQESKENRINGNILQYDPTYRESEIIIQGLNENIKEHINVERNSTMSAFVGAAAGIATGDPSNMALGAEAGHINGKMKRISTNEIGKATINVPISKKIEVKAKETEEKTNIREGEELDDN